LLAALATTRFAGAEEFTNRRSTLPDGSVTVYYRDLSDALPLNV
jgi:hypothetical protein